MNPTRLDERGDGAALGREALLRPLPEAPVGRGGHLAHLAERQGGEVGNLGEAR